jgi:hypothetical protein
MAKNIFFLTKKSPKDTTGRSHGEEEEEGGEGGC